jgi:hypothetical protein
MRRVKEKNRRSHPIMIRPSTNQRSGNVIFDNEIAVIPTIVPVLKYSIVACIS